MKPIYIDDKYLESFASCKTLKDLAEGVKAKEDAAIKNDVVFFISVNFIFNGSKRHEQKGMELLIWLRLKGVTNHCVLYSFESLHALLKREPKYLIATSKGTSFKQMPFVKESVPVSAETHPKAEPESVKQTLKAAFSIDTFRHREANWWGVKSLFDVHRVVANLLNEMPPKIVSDKLDELNNAVAKHIYEYSIDKIQDEVDKVEQQRKVEVEELKRELFEITEKTIASNAEVESVEVEIKKLRTTIQGLEESYKKSNQAEILTYRNDLQKQIEEWQELIQPERELAETDENIRFEKEKKISSLIADYANILSVVKSKYETVLTDFNIAKQIIDSRKIEILYIDDNANNGWKEIFKKMLPKTNIKSIVPDSKHQNNIESLYTEQIKKEIKKETSLILLDLRLYDEEERSIATNNLSGEKLLEIIREDYSAIPILIITASNKIWSYQHLMKLGADAYWIKEGLDEFRTAEESVKNYSKIFLLIEKLTGDKFQLLKEFGSTIKQLEGNQNLWWKDKIDWTKIGSEHNMMSFNVPVITSPDEKVILSILNDSFILLREHIQRTELQNIYNPFQENDWVLPSIIIQHLGKIVEIIHDFQGYEMKLNGFPKCKNRGLIEDIKFDKHEIKRYNSQIDTVEVKTNNANNFLPIRNDRNGSEIFDIRNESSHTNNLALVNFSQLKNLLKLMTKYLTTKPTKNTKFKSVKVS